MENTITSISINFIISLIASLLAVLAVLWLERFRRPVLSIEIGEPGEIKDSNSLGRPHMKWLNIYIRNKKIPRWIGWAYDRNPALTCRAWVTFHRLDGHRIFDREMEARWNETPEPTLKHEWGPPNKDGEKALFVSLEGQQNSVDIPPGEYTDVAIVIRAKLDDECYGFNNQSYFYGDKKQPGWRLEKQRYIAKVRVKTGGREFSEAFYITNDVPYRDFRLESVTDKKLKQNLK